MSLGYIAGVWVPRIDTTNQDDVRARLHLKVVSGNRERNRGEKKKRKEMMMKMMQGLLTWCSVLKALSGRSPS